MSKIDGFVSKLTTEETRQAALACLEQLPREEAWDLVKDWIRSENLEEEAGAEFGEASDEGD